MDRNWKEVTMLRQEIIDIIKACREDNTDPKTWYGTHSCEDTYDTGRYEATKEVCDLIEKALDKA